MRTWTRSRAPIAPALLAIIVAILSACGPKTYDYPYAKEPDPRMAEYVIGVGDVLSIGVWKDGDLSTTLRVRPDGTITMPLVGDVEAEGMTPTELKEHLTAKLIAFIKEENAVVTVAVDEVNSYRVTVSGKVSRPGVIEAPRYMTVADAIAAAGGPTRFAEADAVVVVRKEKDGTVRRIPINYEELAAGRGLHQNIVLMRDDQVYVP